MSATRDWIGSGIKALSTDCCAVPQEDEALLEERSMSKTHDTYLKPKPYFIRPKTCTLWLKEHGAFLKERRMSET